MFLINISASESASAPTGCRCRPAFCMQCCRQRCSVLQLVHVTIPLAKNKTAKLNIDCYYDFDP